MTPALAMDYSELTARLSRHGQAHLLRFWTELSEPQRRRLAEQLSAVDLAEVDRLYRGDVARDDWAGLARRAEPPPAFRLHDRQRTITPESARRRGREALAAGQVGVVIVAGGQGTRLGFHHPKGMLPIGPVSGHSLLQILLEKIVAVGRRYGVRVPLYLMTSPATHDETAAYLLEHGRFGLAADDCFLFTQGTMPAVDADTGRLLLAERDSLALSPDGHGGMLAALARSGALADAQRRGIHQLFYLQVDNPLAVVCDPEFLGYHLLSGSELSTQVVAKQSPLDAVGNVVAVDGQVRIIEYIDLPEDVACQTNADGSLRLWAGSIAVHVFDVAFLQRTAKQANALPFHVARKRVPYLDDEGRRVEPSAANALKFERFIFDLLPTARNAMVMEVDAAEAFAPVKNGNDAPRHSPRTVAQQMAALHTRWLHDAGATVAPGTAVEISPLFALDAEEVARRVPPGTRVDRPRFFA